jgi:hypothetical protein
MRRSNPPDALTFGRHCEDRERSAVERSNPPHKHHIAARAFCRGAHDTSQRFRLEASAR